MGETETFSQLSRGWKYIWFLICWEETGLRTNVWGLTDTRPQGEPYYELKVTITVLTKELATYQVPFCSASCIYLNLLPLEGAISSSSAHSLFSHFVVKLDGISRVII